MRRPARGRAPAAGLPRGARRSAALLPGVLLGVLLAACANDRPRPITPANDLFDPNPTRRVQAVAEVRRLSLQEHVGALIEMLDDEDETVRLVAGHALRELTGRDTQYRPYADPAERRRQVEEWRAWWAGRARLSASPQGNLTAPAPKGTR